MHNKHFNNTLKSEIKINSQQLQASRNIFEEAWQYKDNYICQKNRPVSKIVSKVLVTAILCILLTFSTVFAVSPETAKGIYSYAVSFFSLVDVNGKYEIVEKTENDKMEYENIGCGIVEESEKTEMENKLGYEIFLPNILGNDFTKQDHNQICIRVYNITYKELDTKINEFIEAGKDDKVFQDLSEYKMERYIYTVYKHPSGREYLLSFSKPQGTISSRKVVDTFLLKDIDCQKISDTRAVYPVRYIKLEEGNYQTKLIGGDDYSKKPLKIINKTYITWNIDGVKYSITNLPPMENRGEKLKMKEAKQLASEYIEALRQSSN